MDNIIKQRLEKLKKENKLKIAKKQLIDELKTKYDIDITNRTFIDHQVSNYVHKKVYERIRENDIKIEKFRYEYNTISKKLEWVFNIFKIYEDSNIFFFPSTFGYYYRSCNNLYLDFPIAVYSIFKESKADIFKIIHEMFDDIVVVEENLKYGLVISEDEYQYISIEYWGV